MENKQWAVKNRPEFTHQKADACARLVWGGSRAVQRMDLQPEGNRGMLGSRPPRGSSFDALRKKNAGLQTLPNKSKGTTRGIRRKG